jgi:hypothetical protein
MKKSLPALIIILISALACSPSYYKKISAYQARETNSPYTNYSDLQLWAAHPHKKDPSDSVPQPFRNVWQDSAVDVFFIHPTTFTDPERTDELNANLTDDSLNIKTDYTSILYQASVFNGDCRVFAPRYRQAHIGMYKYQDTAKAWQAFDTAYSDIRAAFTYYLENYKGRPIIIASHSQGTQHAKRLLKEFFDGQTLGNRLVAAYLLGIPVDRNEFKNIPVCSDSFQTGCFVSWRTYRKDFEGPEYLAAETPKAVVNPLNWKADTSYAPKPLNKGAILYNFNKLIKAPNDAQIHKNILWVSRPKFPGASFYKSKNYHAGDYNLFYANVRQDVRRRIGLFWKN